MASYVGISEYATNEPIRTWLWTACYMVQQVYRAADVKLLRTCVPNHNDQLLPTRIMKFLSLLTAALLSYTAVSASPLDVRAANSTAASGLQRPCPLLRLPRPLLLPPLPLPALATPPPPPTSSTATTLHCPTTLLPPPTAARPTASEALALPTSSRPSIPSTLY